PPAGGRDVRQIPEPDRSGPPLEHRHNHAAESEAGYVTRHRLPFGGWNRPHDLHHFDIALEHRDSRVAAGALFGIAAHGLDQIVVGLASEPRRDRAANEVLLMTNLTECHSAGRRRGGGASGSGPRRPVPFREM